MSQLPPTWLPPPLPPPPRPAGERVAGVADPDRGRDLARGWSQVATLVVCLAALGIVATVVDSPSWGVAAGVALSLGVATSLVTGIGRRFSDLSGLVAALLTGFVLCIAWIAFANGGAVLPFGFVVVGALFVLGLDWRYVDRLRLLPFGSGVLIVLVAWEGRSWLLAAVLGWSALALVALALLEADRRAGQPALMGPEGAPLPRARPLDAVASVAVALAFALIIGLLLTLPSCLSGSDRSTGLRGSEREVPGLDRLRDGLGSEVDGRGERIGERIYVPDPNGRFLLPPEASAPGAPMIEIPDPGADPQLEPGEVLVLPGPEGSTLTYEGLDDGSWEVTVGRPDRPDETFRYTPRSDGLVEIERLGPDGEVTDRWWYDPDGVAGSPAISTADPERDAPDPSDEDGGFDWPEPWVIAAVLAAVAALVGLVVWWRRRSGPAPEVHPEAPPWAVELTRALEAEGAARGRVRGRSESVVRYGAALAADELPDDRLLHVSATLSDALFSGRDPGPEAEAWCRSAFASAVEAHPRPGRSERRQRARGAGRPARD